MKAPLYIAFIFALLSAACNKPNPGYIVFKNVDPFTEIELNSTFDVYLIEDSAFFLEFKGEQSQIENIIYSVADSRLFIDNTSKNRFLTPDRNQIELYIHTGSLSLIKANETCNLNSLTPLTGYEIGLILQGKANQGTLDLDCNTFYFYNIFPCGGKLTLTGQTNNLKLWNHAIMSVDAKNVVSSYCLVENHSKGNCEVYATTKLDYAIFGEGDIILYSDPPIINVNAENSKGKLKKR